MLGMYPGGTRREGRKCNTFILFTAQNSRHKTKNNTYGEIRNSDMDKNKSITNRTQAVMTISAIQETGNKPEIKQVKSVDM